MGNKIAVCHWDDEVGHWNAIEVSVNALNGHENHELDIWAPFEGDQDGMNWPQGEAVYLNGCVLEATPEPTATATSSPSPTPSATLPETGAGENATMGMVGVVLIAVGAWMKWKSVRT